MKKPDDLEWDFTVVKPKKKTNLKKAVAQALEVNKHLPGQHDQSSHAGNRAKAKMFDRTQFSNHDENSFKQVAKKNQEKFAKLSSVEKGSLIRQWANNNPHQLFKTLAAFLDNNNQSTLSGIVDKMASHYPDIHDTVGNTANGMFHIAGRDALELDTYHRTLDPDVEREGIVQLISRTGSNPSDVFRSAFGQAQLTVQDRNWLDKKLSW